MKHITPKTSETPPQQVELHLNLRLLPFLVIILAALYILTGFKGWLVFFIGFAGVWLVAGLWVRSMRRNLWVERKIHLAWATAGESVPEQVKLVNQGILPALWVELTDESTSHGSLLRMVSEVGQHSSRNRNISHLFTHRGVYTLGPTHLRCSDPFGIYTLSMQDQHTSTILVTPPILPLSWLKIPTGGWTGDERYRRGYLERNISDIGLRKYVPGDSLRRINWRASAHFNDLIVRQQEAATSKDWHIYVDLDRDAQAGIGQHSTLELSIILAASLAMRGLREYRRVGLILAGPKYISLEPGSDLSHGWRILRTLAMAEAGSHSLADLIQQSHSSQATSILITASTNPIWVATASRNFQGSSLIALLIDPTDFGNPIDQSKAISALAHSRIPYYRMPGKLLDEAYTTFERGALKRITGGESLRRFLQQGRQAWKSMD